MEKLTHPPFIEANGEKLMFVRLVEGPSGSFWEVEAEVQPGAGPPMHTHLLQDEYLEIEEGRMGVEYEGKIEYLEAGEGHLFKAGVSHRFWNAGDNLLKGHGYIKPALNFRYFLTHIYRSIEENGGRPSLFDVAYLITRYKSEYSMDAIPAPVQKVLFPIVLLIGKLLGKYKRFENAPEPV